MDDSLRLLAIARHQAQISWPKPQPQTSRMTGIQLHSVGVSPSSRGAGFGSFPQSQSECLEEPFKLRCKRMARLLRGCAGPSGIGTDCLGWMMVASVVIFSGARLAPRHVTFLFRPTMHTYWYPRHSTQTCTTHPCLGIFGRYAE